MCETGYDVTWRRCGSENGLRRKLDGRAENDLDAVDRGCEVKDVLRSIINVVGEGL